MTEVVLSESELAERLPEMLDKVSAGETQVLVMRNGKAVANLAPLPKYGHPIIGDMRGQVRILGDIVNWSSEDDWDVLRPDADVLRPDEDAAP